MGSYLGVNAVKQHGQPKSHAPERQPIIPQGNRLIAIVDNGVWQIAPDVTSQSNYDDFYQSYSRGNWLTMSLYLLPENKVENCPDEGRVPLGR